MTGRDINERKQAEPALKASEQRFRALAESFPVGVFENDLAGRCIYVNDRTTGLVGVSASECLDFGWMRALFEEDRAQIQRRWEQCVCTLQPFREEYRFRHADGTLTWVIGQAAALTDDAGGHTGFIGTLTDITARKRVEEELRESEERYRDLVENSRDLLCTHDLEGKLLSVNEAAVRLTGYSREALLRMSMADLLTSGGHDLFGAYLRAIREQGVASGLMRIRTAGGESRWWEYHNTLRTEGVSAPLVRGMAHDVTERKRAEDALRANEAWFRTLADSTSVSIFIYQGEHLVYANRTTEALSGYPAAEILALPFWDLIHPDHRQLVRERGMSRQRGEPMPKTYEVKIARKDGAERWIDFTAGNIQWKGKPAVIGTASDITERKHSEDALRQSRQLLETVFASLDDAIFLIDPSTRRVAFCNGSVQRVFGYTESEILGRNAEFLHVDRTAYDEFGAQLLPALDAHGFWRTQYRMRRKDGSTFASEHVVTEVVDDAGRRTGVVSVVRDITERKRAEQELHDSAKRLQGLSRRLVEAEETERRNINRELHDRVGQNLSALNINLNLIRFELPQESVAAVGNRFSEVQRLVEETAGQIRNVMADLHPPALDDYGLLAALQAYVGMLRTRLAVPIALEGEAPDPRLPRVVEMALFRVAQGALANAVAHANARQIQVVLGVTAERVTLAITDNGIGFDVTRVRSGSANWGLAIMRERAEAIGATLSILSGPGSGTRVVVETALEAA